MYSGTLVWAGTSPLAIHDFVEIVRIVNVRGFHTYILSICDGDRRAMLRDETSLIRLYPVARKFDWSVCM